MYSTVGIRLTIHRLSDHGNIVLTPKMPLFVPNAYACNDILEVVY